MIDNRNMASVNPHTRELVYKLVFYGPGLGGKTTTLQYIYGAVKTEHRGKMVSLATPTDRTLYFDFLPLELPKIRGMNVRLQLFTVPGQVYYAATRKLVLSGADGVVFVADSDPEKTDANRESLEDLRAHLIEHNRSIEEVPLAFQWNKRDLPNAMPVAQMERELNTLRVPSLGTVATSGEGVFESLERIMQLILKTNEREGGAKHTAVELAEAMRVLTEAAAQRSLSSGPRPPAAARVRVSGTMPSVDGPDALLDGRRSDPPASPAVKVVTGVAHASLPVGSTGGASGVTPTSNGTIGTGSGSPAGAGAVGSSSPGASAATRGSAPSAPLDSRGEPSQYPLEFSFSSTFGRAEREYARQAESMLAAQDAVNGVLACDVLVARMLASAASFVGTLDAPRDPALVAVLLRLDGQRYVWFRALVRAARHREPLTLRDAYEAYAFALDVRRARDALGSAATR